MIAQLLRATPFAAVLAAAAFSMPAQAHVSWSLGISAPIAPGVSVGIGAGRPYVGVGAVVAPAPVYYAPRPVVYAPPPVYVAPAPVYAPAPVVYGPPVYVPRYHHYRPAVVYRPAPVPVVVRPGHRGPYGPVAYAR